jgi:nucleotide-binding universal stress UspA family protein/anti-anti-sigma regulatory factor
MIIETKDDVVQLSGSLHKNQWMTIKAAANLLLHAHPQGIIVDCSHLETISEDGAKTFLEAMRDIEAAKSRIVFACLPKNILSVCKMVPGVRSQLPIADSVEAARASLHVVKRAAGPDKNPGQGADGVRRGVILVPLVAHLELTYGASLAGRLARLDRYEVRLVYFLEVPRTLPQNAPLLEEEQAAQEALTEAVQSAKQVNVTPQEHVERVRDAAEGILAMAKAENITLIILGATNEPIGAEGHDRFHHLVDTLLHRAPCEVLIGRQKPNE